MVVRPSSSPGALPHAVATVLLAPVSLAAAALLWRHAAEPRRLRTALALAVAAANLHGLAMAAGLASMAWS
jgi:1,4-dihydroxy-2-naphthoate octaprenyltransferase